MVMGPPVISSISLHKFALAVIDAAQAGKFNCVKRGLITCRAKVNKKL